MSVLSTGLAAVDLPGSRWPTQLFTKGQWWSYRSTFTAHPEALDLDSLCSFTK